MLDNLISYGAGIISGVWLAPIMVIVFLAGFKRETAKQVWLRTIPAVLVISMLKFAGEKFTGVENDIIFLISVGLGILLVVGVGLRIRNRSEES